MISFIVWNIEIVTFCDGLQPLQSLDSIKNFDQFNQKHKKMTFQGYPTNKKLQNERNIIFFFWMEYDIQ